MEPHNIKRLRKDDNGKQNYVSPIPSPVYEKGKSFNIQRYTLSPSFQDFKDDTLEQLNQNLKNVR